MLALVPAQLIAGVPVVSTASPCYRLHVPGEKEVDDK